MPETEVVVRTAQPGPSSPGYPGWPDVINLVADIRKEVKDGQKELGGRIDTLTSRLDDLMQPTENRLTKVEEKQEAQEKRMDAQDNRIDGVVKDLGELRTQQAKDEGAASVKNNFLTSRRFWISTATLVGASIVAVILQHFVH